ncbi:hypothetical protein A4D02_01365 [Niastella koreensis]|uniref:Uncharacterized protein n=2 Tax=Niastella koreensis TaxID=354356 RepID=G8TF26_NIAKG|nr:hypothetical protein [Niastella koreensis]AEW02646.1 hypothetical protein Niako_6422 [Niastella koreensis GR20-10]OQP54997.1 hypothetical protein A4D02_01365 [Niastella koreensis]
MKRNVLYNLMLLPVAMLIAAGAMSQALVEDQNPDYMISQVKYLGMADSLNALHGTTPQETYKAIDWMEQRQERRDARRAFRRELRLARAQYGWYYNDYGYYNYYPNYYRNNSGYYSSYYPAYNGNYYDNYTPYRSYNNSRYYNTRWNNWNWVPLAATAATVGWLLTR